LVGMPPLSGYKTLGGDPVGWGGDDVRLGDKGERATVLYRGKTNLR